MVSPSSTWMDIDDTNPQDLQPGVGLTAAPTEADSTNPASRSLETSMELLESAMQSLGIQTPVQEQQRFWNPFTESLKSSITYAQNEIDKLDDEMSKFIHEMGEGRFNSKEAFDLVDQMRCTRQDVWVLVDQSWELGQKFVELRQQIEDRKHENVYLPGLTVSFNEAEELSDAIWDLKCLVEGHVDILEMTRKRQVELLTHGSMLQSLVGA